MHGGFQMCDADHSEDEGVSRRRVLTALAPAAAIAVALSAEAKPAPAPATGAIDPKITGLLIVDPYNDFISEGGKLYGACSATMKTLNTVEHMKQILAASRAAGVQVFFVPHHRAKDHDFDNWKYMAPVQAGAARAKVFAEGTWGGEFHPDFKPQPGDVVAQTHWMSSGFADTDLERQLRAHGVERVIIVGLRANTCIESTMRYAAELGFHVTLVKDAIGAFNMEEIKSATELNGPSYASAILATSELVATLKPKA